MGLQHKSSIQKRSLVWWVQHLASALLTDFSVLPPIAKMIIFTISLNTASWLAKNLPDWSSFSELLVVLSVLWLLVPKFLKISVSESNFSIYVVRYFFKFIWPSRDPLVPAHNHVISTTDIQIHWSRNRRSKTELEFFESSLISSPWFLATSPIVDITMQPWFFRHFLRPERWNQKWTHERNQS